MNPPDAHADVAALTYEQARDELVAVVARLEAGGESLEESLTLWERGEALAARCQQWLDGARDRLAAVRTEHPTGAAAGATPTGPTEEDDR
ncbi:exodeoxyribonuclease VII small subunit [Cellulomonas biazotea]|uniref:exodeoxyribonuclease VII small subunit n=1 Tax=Cellulomonas biazotea TaxID=1709 RepID=UPI001FECB4C4|nr:exodeoxyribonuclease VII small subunit [Cellulomonas biazotea]